MTQGLAPGGCAGAGGRGRDGSVMESVEARGWIYGGVRQCRLWRVGSGRAHTAEASGHGVCTLIEALARSEYAFSRGPCSVCVSCNVRVPAIYSNRACGRVVCVPQDSKYSKAYSGQCTRAARRPGLSVYLSLILHRPHSTSPRPSRVYTVSQKTKPVFDFCLAVSPHGHALPDSRGAV